MSKLTPRLLARLHGKKTPLASAAIGTQPMAADSCANSRASHNADLAIVEMPIIGVPMMETAMAFMKAQRQAATNDAIAARSANNALAAFRLIQ